MKGLHTNVLIHIHLVKTNYRRNIPSCFGNSEHIYVYTYRYADIYT